MHVTECMDLVVGETPHIPHVVGGGNSVCQQPYSHHRDALQRSITDVLSSGNNLWCQFPCKVDSCTRTYILHNLPTASPVHDDALSFYPIQQRDVLDHSYGLVVQIAYISMSS
jgi:hypothetical protein